MNVLDKSSLVQCEFCHHITHIGRKCGVVDIATNKKCRCKDKKGFWSKVSDILFGGNSGHK